MIQAFPIYTETAQCQDCYKCLRHCPVKAIRVEDHRAMVIPDRCIWCGTCVRVCPAGAKKVRNDLDRAKHLLSRKEKVIASLAPSFITEFPGIKPEQLITSLKTLGFYGVSETAIGAQEVSHHTALECNGIASETNAKTAAAATEDRICALANRDINHPLLSNLHLSSACPSAVSMVRKYFPHLAGNLSNIASPLLAHCMILKKIYGEDVGVVFIGPCIAKKTEADSHPNLLNVAITFHELRQWLTEKGLLPSESSDELAGCDNDNDNDDADEVGFIPERARESVFYPEEGGMLPSMKSAGLDPSVRFMSFSGLSSIWSALQESPKLRGAGASANANATCACACPTSSRAESCPDSTRCSTEGFPLFLELLACDGGCINGPGTTFHSATVQKRLNIADYARGTFRRLAQRTLKHSHDNGGDSACMTITAGTNPLSQLTNCRTPYENHIHSTASELLAALEKQPSLIVHTEEEIGDALHSIGKYKKSDELNCSGCGYDSCRDFAAALLNGNAEPAMCVSHMRRLAMKKANALIRTMPSGVVIVNSQLRIIECNSRFAQILGGDAKTVYDACPTMEGVYLAKITPFADLFRKVLDRKPTAASSVTPETSPTTRQVAEQGKSNSMAKVVNCNGKIIQLTIFPIELGHIVGGLIQDITQPAIEKEQVINKAREVIHKNLTTVQQIAWLLGENASETEILLTSIIDAYSAGATADPTSVSASVFASAPDSAAPHNLNQNSSADNPEEGGSP